MTTEGLRPDRRMQTRDGPVEISVRTSTRGYVAQLADGSLAAFAVREDDAVTSLARAVDAVHQPADRS